MSAITIADLENAKTDVDHIAAIANSLLLTAEDRLGNIKDTIAGAIYKIGTFTNRGAWAGPGTVYAVKDLVLESGVWYVAVSAHTSAAAFATDVLKWRIYQGVTTGDLSAIGGADIVGFSHAASATPGTVGAKLHETISVKDAPYLAAGDGVTDDTDAISDALADADGKVLYLPAGTYLTTNQMFEAPNGIKIKGDGIGRTIVKLADGSSQTVVFRNIYDSNVEIEDMTVDCNRAGQTGDAAISVRGIMLGDDTVSGDTVTGLAVRRVRVTGATQHGIQICRSSKGLFEDNMIDDCGNASAGFGFVLFRGCTDNIVEGNRVTGDAAYATYCMAADDRSSDSTTSEPCQRNVFSANIIDCNGAAAGIDFEGSPNNVAIGNIIRDASQYGILLGTSNSDSVPNNQSNDCIVVSNMISGGSSNSSDYCAVRLSGVSRCVVGPNLLSDNTSRGVVIGLGADGSSPDNNDVSGNTMHDVSTGVLATAGSYNSIKGNKITASAGSAIRLVASGAAMKQNDVDDNKVFSATDYGISIESNTFAISDTVVQDNKVRNSSTRGVSLTKGAAAFTNAKVLNNTFNNDGGSMTIGVRLDAGVGGVITLGGNSGFNVTTLISDASGTGAAARVFTCGAANAVTVNDTDVSATSMIVITPTNAAAATLMSGAKSLYLSARTAGTSFVFTTADGNAAAGTEAFQYRILN